MLLLLAVVGIGGRVNGSVHHAGAEVYFDSGHERSRVWRVGVGVEGVQYV